MKHRSRGVARKTFGTHSPGRPGLSAPCWRWRWRFGLAPAPVAQTSRSGFTRIFDGRTTKGWHFSGTVHHGTTGLATVTKDGVLQLTQRPFGQGGLFLTDKTYKNFHLYLEVKVPFASNSGIFLRSTEGGSAYQVELVQGGATGQLLGEGLRLSQGIPAPDLTNIWKTDEFNAIEVRMEGDAPHITIWINGVKTGKDSSRATIRSAGWSAATSVCNCIGRTPTSPPACRAAA